MAMVINTNIASINAQRHLEESRGDLETAMERLSSGKRINSAVDDAAGGAIASRMETRVSGMEQLIRNVNDGVSMVQIAESAMGEVNNMLQRMRDLAIQSTNSTLNATDRQTLQLEVDQLIDEINTIAATTQFNGQNILAGTGTVNSIQSGLNAGEAVNFQISGVSASKLGLSGGSAGQIMSGRTGSVSITSKDVYINGVDLGAITSTTSKDLATAINLKSGLTGVKADAFNRVEGGVVGLGNLAIGAVTINTTSVLNGSGSSSFSSLTELADSINEQVANVIAEVTSDGALVLSNTTGEDLVINGAGTAAAGLEDASAGAITYKGFVALSNNDGSNRDITLTTGYNADGTELGTEADLKAMGLMKTEQAGVISGDNVDGTFAAAGGDTDETNAITINSVSIGAVGNSTAGASAAQYVSAINAVTEQTGVTASAYTEFEFSLADSTGAGLLGTDTASTAAAPTLTINGTDIVFAAEDRADDIVTAINTYVSSVGITAEATTAGNIKLSAATGIDIVVEGSGFNSGTEVTTKGKLTLTDADGGDIAIGSLATTDATRASAVAEAGLVLSNGYSSDGSGLNISTVASASSALETLDNAIVQLSNSRAEMGSYMKRFEAETSNLQVSIEKTAAALSTIMDADYAVESANLAKAQVLQQAGTAMLAQANASTQNVLSLLK